MTTAPLTSTSAAKSPTAAAGAGKAFDLKPEDFIKLMITQLKNQNPTEPAKNEQLLAQMSQIGQLQSSTSLQTSLSKMVLQNNLGAAGNLIGKSVTGLNGDGEEVAGTVTSVRVEGDDVVLELDNGNPLNMSRVTQINDGMSATLSQ